MRFKKAKSLLLVLMLTMSTFAGTILQFSSDVYANQESNLSQQTEKIDEGTERKDLVEQRNAQSVKADSSNGESQESVKQATPARNPVALENVVIKVAAEKKAKLYAKEDSGKTNNLLEGVNLSNGEYKLSAKAGEYRLYLYDSKEKTCYGSIKLVVTKDGEPTGLGDNAERNHFTVLVVTGIQARNAGWIEGVDYTISVSVKNNSKKIDREVEKGKDEKGANTVLAFDGDGVSATFTPDKNKHPDYLETTATKTVNSGFTNFSSVDIPQGVEVKFEVPKGAVVDAGVFHTYYIFDFNKPTKVEKDKNGKDIYTFNLPKGKECFYRVKKDDNDAVTYWNYKSWGESSTVEVTEKDLYIGDSSYNKDTVYKNYEKNPYDLSDIYLNVNKEGYLNLSQGETFDLNVFRNWFPIENFMNSKVALPDFSYKVINFDGTPSDIVSIDPNEKNSGQATLTAKKKGTAVVLVTYDAVTHNAGQYGKIFGATWPERTGVFVVSVDEDGTSIAPQLNINEGLNYNAEESLWEKEAKDAIDAEHDIIFFTSEEGVGTYSFKGEKGLKVQLANPEIKSGKLTYKGFLRSYPQEKDGKYVIDGLMPGRNILKITKDGKSTYQVITAREVSYKLYDESGTKEITKAKPGDTVTVQFSGLTNPSEKLSGVYNFNANIHYFGEAGEEYNAWKGGIGQYGFNGDPQCQRIQVTIPDDLENHTAYKLKDGNIRMGGFGSPSGKHRDVKYKSGLGQNFTARPVNIYLGKLPDVSIPVQSPVTGTCYISVSDDDKYIVSDGIDSGTRMHYVPVDLAEAAKINLEDYNLQDFISYDKHGNEEPITLLKVYLYVLDKYYKGTGKALEITGSAGSLFMNNGFFGHDCNLTYYVNGKYPLMYAGWGATADTIVIKDGDFIDVSMYSDWSFWGDSKAGYHYFLDKNGSIQHEFTVKQGEELKVGVGLAWGNLNIGGDTYLLHESGYEFYSSTEDELFAGGTPQATDNDGYANINFDKPGTYYLYAYGAKGENTSGIVSTPAYAKVIVEPADLKKFDVNFDVQGHGKTPDKQSVAENGNAKNPGKLTEKGYIFKGWYKDKECTVKFDFDNEKITENTTVYAKWFKNVRLTPTKRLGLSGTTMNWDEVPGADKYKITLKRSMPNPKITIFGKSIYEKEYDIAEYLENMDAGIYEFSVQAKNNVETGPAKSYKIFIRSVTFDTNGNGTAPKKQNVISGTYAKNPGELTAKGYTFDGWYKDKECTSKFDFATEKISKNTTVYAKWTINKYKVEFDVQGHGTAPAEQVIEYDKHASDPGELTAKGYTFGGWYKDKECTSKFDFATEKISKDTTVYAKWTKNTYKVKFDVQGHGTAPAEQVVEEDENASNPGELTAKGYTFGGWYKDKECTSKFDFATEKISKNTTVYAKWTKNAYKVKFDVQGHGTAPAEQIVEEDANAKNPGELTAKGYTFVGWYKDKECTSKFDFATEKISKETTVYAKWTKNTYKVKFDVQGHGTAPAEQIVDEDANAKNPGELTAKGYTFVGWYKEKECTNKFDFATERISKDTTVYAKWTKNAYKVKFDVQGHGTAPAEQIVEEDANAKNPGELTAKGYTFGGWYKDKECTNKFDFATEKISKDTTVYAKWTKNAYKVKFDVQGHGTAPAEQIVEEDANAKNPGELTAKGYTFVGWYKDKECTSTFDFATEKISKDTTVYAKWTTNKYNVTFNFNGGELNGQKAALVIEADFDGYITIPEGPEKNGYKFLYWKGSKYYPGQKYKIEGNHTFTAIYEKVDEKLDSSESDDSSHKKDEKTEPSNKSNQSVEKPKTGDANQYLFAEMLMLIVISSIGIITIGRNRKRDN